MISTTDTSRPSLRELIVSDEPTVGLGDSLSAGIEALECSRCGTVVVTDGEGLFRGTFDLTCGLRARLPGYAELLEDPRVLPRRLDQDLMGEPPVERKICEFADQQPVTVGESASLTQLTVLFARHRVEAIPVLSGSRSLGLVSRVDLAECVFRPRSMGPR